VGVSLSISVMLFLTSEVAGQRISRGAKIAWMVFIILVPVVSWIAYGIVRHRHRVGPGR
jgi:cation transporter-like permease